MDKAKDYGIDYERGVANCVGSEEFYEKILSMFLNDTSFARAKAAYEARDYAAMFSCMHELKGVSGNAALVGLYNAAIPLVEILRNGNADDAEVDKYFAAVEAGYNLTVEGVGVIIARE